jgi:hypothetical protein
MARIIRFEGRTISVPDDATDEEVASIIDGSIAKPQEQKSLLSRAGEAAMQYGVRPLNELAGAVVEPIAKIATGAIAKPVGEIAGMAAAGSELVNPQGGDPEEFKKYVQEQLTYQPRTSMGASEYNPLNAIPEAIGSVVGYGAGKVGETTKELTGSDIAASGAEETAMQAAGFLGVKGAPKVKATVAELNKAKLAELNAQKALDAETNRIRKQGQDLGLIAPTEGRAKSTLAKMGGADPYISIKNREIATNKISEEIGLKKGAVTDTDISNRISELSSHYGAVENALGKEVPITLDFKRDVYSMLSPMKEKFAQDPRAFAAYAEPIKLLEQQVAPITDISGKVVKQNISPSIVMAKIRQLRSDARKFEKDTTGDPVKAEMASASYDLANLYENLMENSLKKSGKTALLDKFRDSRKKLSQIHVLEQARMDDGLIDPQKLSSVVGKYKADQKFATGNIKTVAEFANTFGNVMKPMRRKDLPVGTRWELAGALGAIPAAATTGNLAYLSMAAPMAARAVAPTLAERGMLQGAAPSYELSSGRRLAPVAAQAGMLGVGLSPYTQEEQ